MSDERRKNKLEKRGRFIIQEVTEKNNTKSPERIRHESICLNKKFYFTNKVPCAIFVYANVPLPGFRTLRPFLSDGEFNLRRMSL